MDYHNQESVLHFILAILSNFDFHPYPWEMFPIIIFDLTALKINGPLTRVFYLFFLDSMSKGLMSIKMRTMPNHGGLECERGCTVAVINGGAP